MTDNTHISTSSAPKIIELDTADAIITTPMPLPEFADFDLPKPLLTALDKLGFSNPTLVQEKTLESALKGNDLMVSAQTGSGKTVAFLLPCLSHVLNTLPPAHSRHKKARPQVLVVCPTRELVQQVTQDTINLVKDCKGIRVASIMGGMSYPKQIAGLKGAQIVIATPGRLLDLESRNNIQLNDVSHMVLDEADRMLDLGFSEDLDKIAKLCEKREQTLLFSATFAKNIVGLAENLMFEPERIELANTQDKHSDISQSLYWTDDEVHKQALLMHWLEHEPIDQVVIFTPTQVETERLALALRKAGHNAIDLHGGMRQFMRMKQIKKLREGKAKILVATDVAARGLDVPSISHVINYGIPMKNEDYVHRIGRTGRAGRQGHAITVSTHADRRKVFALQHFLKQDIEVCEVEGLEPKPYQPRRDKKKNSRRRGKPRPYQSERGGQGDGKKPYNGKKGGGQSKSSDKPFKGKRYDKRDDDGRNGGDAKKPYRKRKDGKGSNKKHGNKSYDNGGNTKKPYKARKPKNK